MKARPRPEPALPPEPPSVVGRDLAHGLLACLPLFLLYEAGLAVTGAEVGRNAAELLLGRALAVLGPWQDAARRILLLLVALVAAVRLRRAGEPLVRDGLRQVAEGLFAAIALGPLLVAAMAPFDVSLVELDPTLPRPHVELSLAGAARLVGGAVWEELLFRVAVYGALFLVVRRLVAFFGAPLGIAAASGEVAALVGSALVFAAFHLAAVSRPLGLGGEPFDAGAFLWRTLAGLSLAGLFRWRGLGVAAWAHGLFNFALALGSGPGVLRGGS